MDKNDIIDRLTPLARKVFYKPELVLTDDLDSSKIDTWTSLAFMNFLSGIEQEFGIKFKMLELLKMNNIGAIVEAVASHCK